MSQRILIVDDDPDALIMLARMLRYGGFETLQAQSGPEALNLLAHSLPDLIVLDLMMPDMDGNEVCRRVKADSRTAHVPVVMLTALSETAGQVASLLSGADEYLVKPVSRDKLVKCVQAVLAHSLGEPEKKSAQIISILGAKAGIGATTLAVNLALTLAAQARVILVDLDQNGSAALRLGLSPARGLHDLLVYPADKLDTTGIEVLLTPHPSGLRLLASADAQVDAIRAGVMLNYLRTMCDVCLLDLGAGVDEWTMMFALRSTALVLALDSDHVNLAQARRVMDNLDEVVSPWPELKLVWINRFGAPDAASRAAVQAALRNHAVTIIGPASEALQQALERDQPLVVSRPDHPIAAQIRALASSLMSEV
jgi:DNA-binding response OmpR family regulator